MSHGSHTSHSTERSPNRLIHETSPYLLQHAYNPVDWYSWGPEAFDASRRDEKPIFLSVGYSACHWCHVMERESFEDEATAQMMNELFVSIKVDREERPDVDAIYMDAVQALTRHGGWPMSVFLLPDGTPFYGGTYYPPDRRHGMPSFREVLEAVANAYRTQRSDVEQSAAQLRTFLQKQPALGGASGATGGSGELSADILAHAETALADGFDPTHGGFGQAPKFPQPMGLEALLRAWRRSQSPQTLHMVTHTLDKMAQGGMYDQLGGGFHRYSVDERWLVPHFEKMLYDNSQLARLYLNGYLATGNPFYRRICEETLDYILREMTSPEGGFYSTQDADSEGEEGKFFLWTPAEVQALVGEEHARLFCAYFDVTGRGNFEHRNILHTPQPLDAVARAAGVSEARLAAAIQRGKEVLFAAREQRIKPGRDEKIITSWNGLMLRAFAEAAAALDREDYRQAAVDNAEFLLSTLRGSSPGVEGLRLLRTYKEGQAKLNAYLEDYAFFAAGLISLYEATFDPRWFTIAVQLAETMIAQFADGASGGFFDTSADHEALITRPKDLYDNATPSGNSVAAEVLLRLAELGGREAYRTHASGLLLALRDVITRAPSAFGHLLCALDLAVGPVFEIALAGDPAAADTQALAQAIFRRYLPNRVVALRPPGAAGAAAEQAIPLLEGRVQQAGMATAYVCRQFTCRLPVTTPEALLAELAV